MHFQKTSRGGNERVEGFQPSFTSLGTLSRGYIFIAHQTFNALPAHAY